MWLVWSNYHMMWWGPNRAGYTGNIAEAGRYSAEEAQACCAMRSPIEPSRIGLPKVPAELIMPSPELLKLLGCDPESLAKIPLATRYVVPRGALDGVPLPEMLPGAIVADERTPLMIEVIKAARAWREAGPPLVPRQPSERALLEAIETLDKAHPSYCPCIFCQGGPIT